MLNNFLVARLLGPEGKGSIYLLQLVASTGPTLLSFGLGPAAVYYLARDRSCSESEIRSGLLRSSLLLGVAPLLVATFAWPWLGEILGSKLSPSYLMLALCAVPFGVLAWNVGFLSLAQGRILSFNLLRSGQGVWFLLCLLGLLVVHRTSLMGVALCWATSMFVLGAFASLAGRTEKNGEEIPTKGFLGMAFRFGWRSHLGAVTQFLQQRIDILLVSYICSLRELGFYSLAVAMAELLWYIPQTVANVLMPHVAGNSDEGASRLTSSFCRAVFAINAFLAVALAIFSAWFIPLMLPAFRASVPVLWLLLPGTMAASISKVLSSDMNGRGRPLETVRPAAFSLAACFLTGALVIPKFGIEGAAVVTSAGYLLNAFLYLHAYSRITAVRAKDLLLLNYQDIRAVQASCKDFASQITR